MERVAKLQAEQQFIAAFSRLKFPPIVKNRKAHSSKYAAFEDIQAVIDPILAEQGFTLTYSSGEPNEKGEVPTFGKLSHIGGHSERGLIYLPPDGVGTKSGGMNMNALQGRGSATAYGQRYVAKMMLNLRFIGDDDDAGGAKTITEAQARETRQPRHGQRCQSGEIPGNLRREVDPGTLRGQFRGCQDAARTAVRFETQA